MKRIVFILIVALTAVISCKKDKDINLDSVTISTIEPIFKSDNSIKTGAKVSVDLNKNSPFHFGICYSVDQNPTLNDVTTSNNLANGYEFESTITSGNYELDKPLYIRAYLQDKNGKIKYGNQVTAKRDLNIKINSFKDIQVGLFTVDYTVGAEFGSNLSSGICYSSSPNPTIQNSNYKKNSESGSGNLLLTSNSFYLIPAQTYYVRAYVQVIDKIYYSEQKTVKLAGFVGESGGLVFYDKGSVSNGWRYLEASKSLLKNANTEFKWSCVQNQSVNVNTSREIGTGEANSIAMKEYCNYANNAASASLDLVRDGKDDWFLPSLDEMLLLAKAAVNYDLIYLGNPGLWTSTQVNQTDGYIVYGYIQVGEEAVYKNNLFNAWPIRKY